MVKAATKVAPKEPDEACKSSEVDNGTAIATTQNERRTLAWGFAFLMNLTFSTSGAVVTYPYTFGILGVATAVLLLLGWMAIALYSTLAIVRAALKCDAKTLGDVGESMGGSWGRFAAELGQIVNLAFYIPVALQLCGDTLTWLVSNMDTTQCLGLWTFVIWAALLLLLQFMHNLHHGKWLTVLSVSLLVIKCFVNLPIMFATESNPLSSAPVQAFGNSAVPASTWDVYAGAISSIPFGVCPIFIVVEIMAEMKEPEKIVQSLYLAFAGMLVLYVVPTIIAVTQWGYNLNDPVTVGVSYSANSVAANLFVLFATFNDAFLSSATMFKFACTRLPLSLKENDYSVQGLVKWLILTVVYFAFALIVATCIPSFMTLVGLLTSLTVVLPNATVPACFIIVDRRRAQASTASFVVPILVAIVGVGISAYILAGTIIDVTKIKFGSFENTFCGYS